MLAKRAYFLRPVILFNLKSKTFLLFIEEQPRLRSPLLRNPDMDLNGFGDLSDLNGLSHRSLIMAPTFAFLEEKHLRTRNFQDLLTTLISL